MRIECRLLPFVRLVCGSACWTNKLTTRLSEMDETLGCAEVDMAGGWTRDGAVQEQIDASIEDAIKQARSRLPEGKSLTHCEECGTPIPEARRKVIPGVRLCVKCQEVRDRNTG